MRISLLFHKEDNKIIILNSDKCKKYVLVFNIMLQYMRKTKQFHFEIKERNIMQQIFKFL